MSSIYGTDVFLPALDVIAGAGTAGLALANRLSEDPQINVAVLEAVRTVDSSNKESQLIPDRAKIISMIPKF